MFVAVEVNMLAVWWRFGWMAGCIPVGLEMARATDAEGEKKKVAMTGNEWSGVGLISTR